MRRPAAAAAATAAVVAAAAMTGCCVHAFHFSGAAAHLPAATSAAAAAAAAATARPGVRHGGGVRRRMSEEVESFDVDFDINRLDALNTYIGEVKQKGYVPASSNIVYDCTHGQWLLMQVAYDRKVRLFGCKSAAGLPELAAMVPDDGQVLFTGAMQPKHAKRLLRVRNLHSAVVPDLDSARALDAALSEERARLAAKGLSKVSRSRERFLAADAELGPAAGAAAAPAAALPDRIRVFLKVTGDSGVEEVAQLLSTIRAECAGLEVAGLWGAGREAFALLQGVRGEGAGGGGRGAPKLKVAVPYSVEAAAWSKEQLSGEERGSIIWTFDFE